MKNIIFIAGIPSFSSVLNMHYLYGCSKRGLNIIYINARALLYPDACIEKQGVGELDDIIISSLKEIENILLKYSPNETLCILQHPYDDINIINIFTLIKKLHFVICFFVHYPVTNKLPYPLFDKIKKLFFHPIDVFYNRVERLLNKKAEDKPQFLCKPDFVFTSSPKLKSLFNVNAVKINYTDYNNFLKCKKENTNNFCLFLDSAITHHPDRYLFGDKKTICPDTYFNEINKLFDSIEDKLNLKVIISGHPKSKYKGNEFGGRKIIVGKTVQLVAQSKLVLTHASLSTNYAIYMYKPLIILTYGTYVYDLGSCNNSPVMKAISKELGIPLIDIATKKYKLKIPQVDIKKYDLYKYNYSCWKEIEYSDSEEIVANHIKRL